MTARSALRTLLVRGSRSPRAVLRRVRALVRDARRASAVPVQITLDGHDLLNWRSPDPSVLGLVLCDRRGAAVSSEALAAAGPPHGVHALNSLEQDTYELRTRTARGEREVRLLTAGDGTLNEARTSEAGVWRLETEPTPRLVHRPAEAEPPGLLALEAAHGLVALDIGPVQGAWDLTVERRGGTRRIPVEPRPDRTGAVRVYRLGRAQWGAAGLPLTGETTIWDVILRPGAEPDRRVRVAWRGSGIARPRDAIRLRAVVSYSVAGQRIVVRPYWTKDQHLALELTATPSIGGDPG